MTLLEMITDVKAYSGEQDTTRLKAALNNMYRAMQNKLKWPHLLIPAATPITLSQTQQFDLASDFKWPSRFWVVNPADGQPIYLTPTKRILNNVNKGSSWKYRIKRKNAGTAAARGAWVVELEEIPNASFVSTYTSLYYDYYYQAANLSGDTDQTKFGDDADSVIVFGATILLNAKQDDTKGFQMIGTMYTDGLADLIQRAIELYGEGIVIKPGEEITEDFPSISDYGRKLRVG